MKSCWWKKNFNLEKAALSPRTKRDCLKTMQTFDLDSHFHLPPALTLIAIVASTRSGSCADALEQRKVKPVLRVLPVVKYQTWRNLFILTHSIPWRWVNKASFSLAYCSNRPFVPLAQWKSWSEQISHFIVPSSDLKHITVTTNGRIMRVDKLFGLRRVDEFLAGIKCDAGSLQIINLPFKGEIKSAPLSHRTPSILSEFYADNDSTSWVLKDGN